MGKRRALVMAGDVVLACLSVPTAIALRDDLALNEVPWSSLAVPVAFAGIAAVGRWG
jgi:hypothetical protein